MISILALTSFLPYSKISGDSVAVVYINLVYFIRCYWGEAFKHVR